MSDDLAHKASSSLCVTLFSFALKNHYRSVLSQQTLIDFIDKGILLPLPHGQFHHFGIYMNTSWNTLARHCHAKMNVLPLLLSTLRELQRERGPISSIIALAF